MRNRKIDVLLESNELKGLSYEMRRQGPDLIGIISLYNGKILKSPKWRRWVQVCHAKMYAFKRSLWQEKNVMWEKRETGNLTLTGQGK